MERQLEGCTSVPFVDVVIRGKSPSTLLSHIDILVFSFLSAKPNLNQIFHLFIRKLFSSILWKVWAFRHFLFFAKNNTTFFYFDKSNKLLLLFFSLCIMQYVIKIFQIILSNSMPFVSLSGNIIKRERQKQKFKKIFFFLMGKF